MAVQLAQSMDKRKNQLRYQSPGPISGRPQDPTLEQQAMAIAKEKAMDKVQETTNPMFENAFQAVKDKVNPYITKGVEGVKATFMPTPSAATSAAPIAEGATMAEVAAGAGGNAIGTIGTGLTEAAATKAATGAAGPGMMAGLSAAMPYIGAGLIAGKAFGLFNRGGYVNGPLSKVRYKQHGGPVAEEIEITYGGPLSKGD